MKNKFPIISVDLQHDFTHQGGVYRKERHSVNFIEDILSPFFKEQNLMIHEIISDYRLPKPRSQKNGCHPGTRGYESILPNDIVYPKRRIKCMNSPIWIRENIGLPTLQPGNPYQDPVAFEKWLYENIGRPVEVDTVYLIGLTIDCCVLSLSQELARRGFRVKIIKEATDAFSGDPDEKEMILENYPLKNWASSTSWEDFTKLI